MKPSAFISYSWDNEVHKKWVKELGTQLRRDGIDIKLDQWETKPGDQLPLFMEKSIRDNDFVLIICTPNYRLKSDSRIGGAGYEGDIMTAEIQGGQDHKKFIPVLKNGNLDTAIPTWLKGKYFVDMSSENSYSEGYEDIRTTILNLREVAPPIGNIEENKTSSSSNFYASREIQDVKIVGIIVDEVTSPPMDGTKGSALYNIPFELSHTPNHEWNSFFLVQWNFPSSFTNMHRPGIAVVDGNKIWLNGTTIEEVQKYHRDTLVQAVNNANIRLKEVYNLREQEEIKAAKAEREHRKTIEDKSKELDFE